MNIEYLNAADDGTVVIAGQNTASADDNLFSTVYVIDSSKTIIFSKNVTASSFYLKGVTLDNPVQKVAISYKILTSIVKI